MTLSRNQVQAKLAEYLTDMFEVPADKIRPEARLYEELDLDSIDAVDLVVKLQDLAGRKISPQEFKSVRTVGDVVDKVHGLLNAQ